MLYAGHLHTIFLSVHFLKYMLLASDFEGEQKSVEFKEKTLKNAVNFLENYLQQKPAEISVNSLGDFIEKVYVRLPRFTSVEREISYFNSSTELARVRVLPVKKMGVASFR